MLQLKQSSAWQKALQRTGQRAESVALPFDAFLHLHGRGVHLTRHAAPTRLQPSHPQSNLKAQATRRQHGAFVPDSFVCCLKPFFSAEVAIEGDCPKNKNATKNCFDLTNLVSHVSVLKRATKRVPACRLELDNSFTGDLQASHVCFHNTHDLLSFLKDILAFAFFMCCTS